MYCKRSPIMKTIHTDKAPAAVGPYSQAKVAGGFLFASGQVAINPATGSVGYQNNMLLS